MLVKPSACSKLLAWFIGLRLPQVLGALPSGTHPMTQLCTAVLALQVGGCGPWHHWLCVSCYMAAVGCRAAALQGKPSMLQEGMSGL